MEQTSVDFAVELRGAAGQYTVEFRLSRGIDSVFEGGPFAIPLDPERLRAVIDTPTAYAALLTEMFFGSGDVRDAFAMARGMARVQKAPLRFRLEPGPGAEALHALRWERLNLPGQAERLSTREDVYFSRYLPTSVDAYLPLPPGNLRALAAIAAPLDLERYKLPPVDIQAETKRAAAGLANLQVDYLNGGAAGRCTLQRLADQIPNHDVLYLVCHGTLAQGQGWLLLEAEDGSAERVPVDSLVRRLAGSAALPRLGLLVVCESASGSQAMAALAPQLVKAGIPAVIGMQGALTYPTAETFLPVLFRELRRDGVIDRSVAVARRAILDAPDEAAPVLLMSLLSGALWQAPKPAAASTAVASTAVPSTAPVSTTSPAVNPGAAPDPVQFYQLLNSENFALDDLEELCFTLGVDWDNIRGETKPAKARAMIQYFQGRGRLAELYAAAVRARPNLG